MFGIVDINIEAIKEELNQLDLASDQRDLTDIEVQRKSFLTVELWRQLKSRESILRQKSRFRWIKEGDSSTRFFHRCVKGRQASNAINGLKVNGTWFHEPNEVKSLVEQHFSSIFAEPWENRPIPENIHFSQISLEDNIKLIAPFTDEEIKEAVWQCDSSKIPGPDGYNFKFIKGNWEVMKTRLLQFH